MLLCTQSVPPSPCLVPSFFYAGGGKGGGGGVGVKGWWCKGIWKVELRLSLTLILSAPDLLRSIVIPNKPLCTRQAICLWKGITDFFVFVLFAASKADSYTVKVLLPQLKTMGTTNLVPRVRVPGADKRTAGSEDTIGREPISYLVSSLLIA